MTDHGLALLTHSDHITGTQAVGRDVHHVAVHHDVTVRDELARTATRVRDAQAEHHVVQSAFAELEQNLTGDAGTGIGLLKHVGELLLQDSVGVLRLLLFSELHRVFRFLLSAAGVAVLAGAIRAALERFVWAEDRLLKTAADFRFGSAVTCHIGLLFFGSTMRIKRDDALVGGIRCAGTA